MERERENRAYAGVAAVVLAVMFAFTCRAATGSDFWVSGTDASVVTNNDCGFISGIHGQPVIIRSFHDASAPGIRANLTDRINSGDEIRVPADSRLEVTSGSNVVAVAGAGSRVKFLGSRNFGTSESREVSRIDMELITGELRVQVRMNESRPELALVTTGSGEFLIRRGDVDVITSISWQTSVLSGDAQVRLRRGGTTGAPFTLSEGNLLGVGGQAALTSEVRERIRTRVPFSFETKRAALPPQPSVAYELEAP